MHKIKGFALILLLWTGWGDLLFAGLPGETSLPVGEVYVNPAYTSSTSGWGITHFSSLADYAPGTAIHVADGAALSVDGSLSLDGCLIDCSASDGSFSILFEEGADARIERSLFAGCGQLIVNSPDVFMRNCAFSGTLVQIGASAAGSTFLHNILSDGAELTDSVTAAVVEADGWSNVSSFSDVWNRMSLEWITDELPADRTMDVDGLFIQPGDVAGLNLQLDDLSVPVAGAELVVGYDGTLLTNGTLTILGPWEYNLAENWDASATGRLNAAIGVGMSAPLAGISEDGPVAELSFQTLDKEGRAVLYFRSPDDGLPDNRLASNTNGTSGLILTPFTVNSDTVTIDGTAPVLQPLAVAQDETDLLQAGQFAVEGTVTVTLDALDALAGVAGASLTVSPELSIGSAVESTVGGTNRYSWPVEITSRTLSGTYSVRAEVLDRSGNVSTNFAEFTVDGLSVGLSLPVMEVYVDPAYTSSTPGWGITHFSSLVDFEPGTAIHVADGATLTVTGSLSLDGCLIDCIASDGSFLIVFEEGADVFIERSLVSACGQLTVNSDDVFIQNSQFSGTQVQIGTDAEGVQFVHNILADGAELADSGTATVVEADGWSNVSSLADVLNRMSLEWTADELPVDRTMDEDGLFIQPGDVAGLNLLLDDLSCPVVGVELVVGYDGTLLTNGTLTMLDPWEYNLAENWDTSATGRLNAAIGLGMSAPLAGISEDAPVADLSFQALDNEGRAVLYFRSPDDGLLANRLASNTNGTSGMFLTPFTVNSDTLTIDGTAPVLQPLVVAQGETDLLQTVQFAGTGTVSVTLDALDALAGVAGASLSVSPALNVGSVVESTVGGTNRYIWSVEIPSWTVSGTYSVRAEVLDRSGNVSTNVAEFTVAGQSLEVIVAMDDASDSAYDCDVTIQALDAGGEELKSWTCSSTFLSAQTVCEIDYLPCDTAFLTADTSVSLRRCLPVGFSDGVWLVDGFCGDHALIGGDLNADNAINSRDYVVFRQNFETAEPAVDINGDGAVDSLDLLIIRQNWQQAGE